MAEIVQPVSVGVGRNAMWGYSPAFDLTKYLSCDSKDGKESNVLLAGPGDIRHVLETLRARQTKQNHEKIVVYIWEESLECMARHIILTRILLNRQESIQTRTQTFLESYGNVLVHKKTAELIAEIANQIYKEMAEDAEFIKPFFDLTCLKFRERDGIEDIFKFSRAKKPQFDSRYLWDNRCRHYLGSRYNSAANVIDWDYHMRMKSYAPIIHKLHYRRWRIQGIIVERQGKCTEPNRTLATEIRGMHKKRGPVNVKGFWSDILISPYISYGVHTTEKKFYERSQNQYKKHSVDICEHNLEQVMQAIAPHEKKEEETTVSSADDEEITILEAATMTSGDDEKVDTSPEQRPVVPSLESKAKSVQTTGTSANTPDLSNITVRFLFGDLAKLLAKSKYDGLFDLIFVGQAVAHVCMTKALNKNVSKRGCTVIAETVKYVPVKLNEKKLYVEKLREMGKAAGWKTLGKADLAAMNEFKFPMPSDDRMHVPVSSGEGDKVNVKEFEKKQESYPECMFPFVYFRA
ncbi:hypothetical protein AAMO2058_000451100 [Amorphochlora amoebiformis]